MLTYLIDDDTVSLFVAEQTLRLEGSMAPIISFVGAKEAWAYLQPRLVSEPPEFIFLDLNMPVMDGWAFLDILVPHAAALKDRCQIYLLTSSLALADTEKAQDPRTGAGHHPQAARRRCNPGGSPGKKQNGFGCRT